MEGVPRMPMLSFELKQSPEYVEFGPTLKQYIRSHYGEDPANYNKACTDLEQLRQSAVHVSRDFMGCSNLKKYYAQLQFLQGRFPMGEGGEASIPFTWEDIHIGREITIQDIKFEQACILYNIGMLHSLLGAMDTRQSAEGMKVSCTHFQCAAWALEYLRDHFGCSSMSMDMSHDLLTFHINVMLAQAQECILEKSMVDSRKSSITAKVSKQIVEFYRIALRNLETCSEDGIISAKSFRKRIEMKMLFYECITFYFMGRQSEEQEKWGESLAYFTLAKDKLAECVKAAKGSGQDITDTLQFTNDVVSGKYQSAKKDNDLVYHDKVPSADSLPEVKGASLVKGIPFNSNDPEVSGPDIFQKLVPMKAHETSSLYSEEKAQLLRRVTGSIEEKDAELIQYISSLQIDQSQLSSGPEKLPQELLEKCAAISVRPEAIKNLIDCMGAVSNMATEVDYSLQEIQQLIEEEKKQDEEFMAQFGQKKATARFEQMEKDLEPLKLGHEKGSRSNQDLHNAMNIHIANLRLLNSPLDEIQKSLPSIEAVKEPEDEAVISDLKRLLDKVEEMRTQRAALEQELREAIQSDDITNAIVTQEGDNKEELFKQALKKHEPKISLIEQNLTAQNNILRALTDINAKYAGVRRKTAEASARREARIRELINSYDVYEDLLSKSQKGLEFYKKLESNVTNMLEACKGICQKQQEARDKLTSRFKPKDPPPSRPMAPKPGMPAGVMDPATISGSPQDGSTILPTALPGSTSSIPPGGLASTIMPGFQGPKLKDFLPFMKPKTFGKDTKGGQRLANEESHSSSLPGSGRGSPVPSADTFSSLPPSPSSFVHLQNIPEMARKFRPVQFPQQPPRGQFSEVNPGQAGLRPQINPLASHSPRRPSPAMSPLMQGQGPYGSQGQLLLQGQLPPQGQFIPEHQQQIQQLQQQQQLQLQQQQQQLPSGVIPGQGHVHIQGEGSCQGHRKVAARYIDEESESEGRRTPTSVASYVTSWRRHSREGVYPPYRTGGYHGEDEDRMIGNYHTRMTNTVSIAYHTLDSPPVSTFSGGSAPGMMSLGMFGTTLATTGMNPTTMVASTAVATANQGQMVSTRTPHLMPGQISAPPTDDMGYQVPAQVPAQVQQGQGHVAPFTQAYQPHTPHVAMLQLSAQQIPGQPGPLYVYEYPKQWIQDPQTLQMQRPHQYSFAGQRPSNMTLNQMSMSSQREISSPVVFSQGPKPNVGQGEALVVGQGQIQIIGQGQVQGQPLVTSQVTPVSVTSQPYSHPSSQPYQGQDQVMTQAVPASYPQQVAIVGQEGQVRGQEGQDARGQVLQGHILPQQQLQQQIASTNPSQQVFHVPPFSTQPMSRPSFEGQSIPHGAQQAGQPVGPGDLQHNISGGIGGQIRGPMVPHHAVQMGQQPPQGDLQQQQIQAQLQHQQAGQQRPPFSAAQHQFGPQQQHKQPPMVSQPQQFGPQQQPPMVSQPQQLGPQQQQPMVSQQHQFNPQQPPTVSQQQQLQQFGPQGLLQQPMGSQQPQRFTTQQGQQQQLSPQVQQQRQPQQQQHLQQFGPQLGPMLPKPVLGPGQQQMEFQHLQHQPGSSLQQAQQQQIQQQLHAQQQPGSQQQQQQLHAQQQPGSLQQQQQAPNVSGVSSPFTPGHHQSIGMNTQQQQQLHQQVQQYQGIQQGVFVSSQAPPSSYHPQQATNQLPAPVQAPPSSHPQQVATNQLSVHPVQQQQQHYQQMPQQQQGQRSMQNQNQSNTMMPMSQGQMFPLPSGSPSLFAGSIQGSGQGQGMQRPTGTNEPNDYSMPGDTPTNFSHMLAPGYQPESLPAPLRPSAQGTPGNDPRTGGATEYAESILSEDLRSLDLTSLASELATAQTPVAVETQEQQQTNQEQPMNTQYVQPDPPTSSSQAVPAAPRADTRTDARKKDGHGHGSHSRNLSTSSLDDILSSSPGVTNSDFLTPKVLTAQELQQQKEEAMLRKEGLSRQSSKDPYAEQGLREKFVAEVEKFAKFVEALEKVTCSGPTPLDSLWKELHEDQEKEGRRQSMAIARCYMKQNRELDILPYDSSRVILNASKDDYINASRINELAPSCPKFIATQAPVPCTVNDFWMMVYEQGCEVIVMLSSQTEVGKKFPEYWPPEKNKLFHYGPLTVNLQSVKIKLHWTERIMYLNHTEKRQGRTIVQLQYGNWPVSGFPEKVPHILQFVTEVHSFFKQQRSLMKPVVVHCSTGIGRTGTFMVIYTGMQEIDHGNGIINVIEVAKILLRQRRNAIREKLQLKYCFQAILYYAQDILAKRGILVHKASFGDKLPNPGTKANQWTPTDDIVFGTMPIKTLQTNMERMHQKFPAQVPEEEKEQTEVKTVDGAFPAKSDIPKGAELSVSPSVFDSKNLPDVVQRTGDQSLVSVQADGEAPSEKDVKEVDSKFPETNANLIETSLDGQMFGTPRTSRSGSHSSLKSSDLGSAFMFSDTGSEAVSLECSPLHKGKGTASPTNRSLAEIQDPKTFTLGEGSNKKKITKASFGKKDLSLTDNLNQANDPLSSLDPLWSLGKK